MDSLHLHAPRPLLKAQSMINRSTQNHRIVKEVVERRATLAPIVGIENNRMVDNPNTLLGKFDKVYDVESKDYTKQRVQDLEREVQRLNHHIHQAELSIRSYRGVLTAKSPRSSTNGTKDTYTQTNNDYSDRLEADLVISKQKSLQLADEIISLKEAKDAVFKERKQLQNLNKQKEDVMLGTIKSHENTIFQQKVKIADLEEEQLLLKKSTPIESVSIDNDIFIKELRKHMTKAKELKLELNKLKAFSMKTCNEIFPVNMVQSILSAMNKLQSKHLKYDQDRLEDEAKLKVMQVETSELMEQLTVKQSQLDTANSLIESLQKRLNDVMSNKQLSLSTPVKSKHVATTVNHMSRDQCNSPLSPLQNQQIQELKYNKRLSEQDAELQRISQLCDYHQRRAESAMQQLAKVALAMKSLQEVHAAEIKAVKHEAHIRDLLRVAKEREASIEKDRLVVEVKHLK